MIPWKKGIVIKKAQVVCQAFIGTGSLTPAGGGKQKNPGETFSRA